MGWDPNRSRTAPCPRRFGCVAAPRRRFSFRPKARTAWTEGLDRFWACPEIFLPCVSMGLVKIRDKLSWKIRDKRDKFICLIVG